MRNFMLASFAASSLCAATAFPANAATWRGLPPAGALPPATPVSDGCGNGSYRAPPLENCETSFFLFHDPDRPRDSVGSGWNDPNRYVRGNIYGDDGSAPRPGF